MLIRVARIKSTSVLHVWERSVFVSVERKYFVWVRGPQLIYLTKLSLSSYPHLTPWESVGASCTDHLSNTTPWWVNNIRLYISRDLITLVCYTNSFVSLIPSRKNLPLLSDLRMDIDTLLKNLHEELSCSVCMRTFVEPKQLPFLHSFCPCCLSEILRTRWCPTQSWMSKRSLSS